MKCNEIASSEIISCLLLENFSALACASVCAPLSAFNRLHGQQYYHVQSLGYGDFISNDSGLQTRIDQNLSTNNQINSDLNHQILIIIGGSPTVFLENPNLSNDLNRIKTHYKWIVGVGTGGYALAQSGILDHRKASVHWHSLSELKQTFPHTHFSSDLYSIDHNVATCRSGTAALDLMFTLLNQLHGSDLAEALSQYFVRERVGFNNESPALKRLDSTKEKQHPKLAHAISIMERNITFPLNADELANQVQLSTRQLERLFKQHLQLAPSRYYLIMRLESARKLVLNSDQAITEIALSVGFASSAHFSTSYRNVYGLTPTEDRSIQSSAISG